MRMHEGGGCERTVRWMYCPKCRRRTASVGACANRVHLGAVDSAALLMRLSTPSKPATLRSKKRQRRRRSQRVGECVCPRKHFESKQQRSQENPCSTPFPISLTLTLTHFTHKIFLSLPFLFEISLPPLGDLVWHGLEHKLYSLQLFFGFSMKGFARKYPKKSFFKFSFSPIREGVT